MSSSPRRIKRRRPGTRVPTVLSSPAVPRSPLPKETRESPEHEPAKRQRTEVVQNSQLVDTSSSGRLTAKPSYRQDMAKKGFDVRSTLGSGSYSKVKLAAKLTNKVPELVAVKIVDREHAPSDYLDRFLPRELLIWSRLRHSHLVQLYDHFEASGRVYMVLEYVNEGDALTHVQKHGAVSESVARSWLTQITSAVKYMHDRNISHRDLKLENMLLTDHCMTVKLCDFGFVKEVANTEELSQTFCGSKAYAAPEILRGQPYDPMKGDIWAMGVILYILVTGKMPFDESRGTKKILEEQQSLRLRWNKNVAISPRCHQLIIRMLLWSFAERPTIGRVQRDEWFSSDQLAMLPEYGSSHSSAGVRGYL